MYNLVVCGGTFDHFHKGHISLLKLAFSLGKKVVIGVTSDEYVKILKIKNKISNIENFEKRKQRVLEFLKSEKVLDRVEIIKIKDVFGPTLDKNFNTDAIVVTKDSLGGADLINKERQKVNLPKLKIVVAPLVLGQNNKPISSSQIRQGRINRQGNLYLNPLWLKRDLSLTEKLRKELKKPFGELTLNFSKHSGNSQKNFVITVGDVTTKNFNKANVGQKISVVDFKVARKKKFNTLSELGFLGHEKVLMANNPSGYITSDLFSKIESLLNLKIDKRIILQIEGEEDLAVLPLALLSPLGTIIYYGQPGKGIVKIDVSEKTKEKTFMLLCRFKY